MDNLGNSRTDVLSPQLQGGVLTLQVYSSTFRAVIIKAVGKMPEKKVKVHKALFVVSVSCFETSETRRLPLFFPL